MNSHLLSRSRRHASGLVASVALLGASLALSPLQAADAAALPAKQSDFPPAANVLKDYKQIVSTVDGKSLYKLYRDPKTSHMLAE